MGSVGYLNKDDLVTNSANQKAVALSLLVDDCKRRNVVDWDAVKGILRCHPPVASDSTRRNVDPLGRIFVVELVSRNPPVDVVEEALRVYPDSLTLNVSCFFAACQRASLQVMRSLARHVVVMQTNNNNTCPYPWITLSHFSVEGARIMLEEYPQGALHATSGNGLCPLDHMLFSASSAIRSHKTTPQWWAKVKLLLTVAEFGSVRVPNGRSFHLLNALLRRVSRVKPQVFADRKEAKDLLWLLHQLSVMEDPCLFQTRDDEHGDFPLHVLLRSKFHSGPCLDSARQIVSALIQAHPPSARLATREGRLALHISLENGWPCHDLLLRAAPDTLQLRDLKTGLYPFQTAACAKVSWEQQGNKSNNRKRESVLDITYTLLREDPVQAARGLTEGMLID